MRKIEHSLIFLTLLLVGSSLLCKVFVPPATPEPAQQDIRATLESLQATQAVLMQSPTPRPVENSSTLEPAPRTAQPSTPMPTEVNAPDAPLSSPNLGSISGDLSYPSEGIPSLRVVATNINTGQLYFTDTGLDQSSYTIDNLPPGVYTVVAYTLEAGLLPSAGFTQAVLCGLTADCTDHTLNPMTLTSGQSLTGVDPADWYAPEGAFPPDPTR